MRYPTALACTLVGLITVGCNNKDSKPFQSKDPVQGLQEFNEKFKGELNASKPVISAPDGSNDQWYKRQVFTSDQMSYDVTKTDSLVSPFVGKVEFNCNFHVLKGPSAQAITTAPFVDAFKDKCVLALAHQKGRWVAKSMVCMLAGIGTIEIKETDTSPYSQCLQTARRIAPD
jgi:hypothetical protein